MTDTFLLNDFYTIDSVQNINDQNNLATISINAQHPVFKGHFEQIPVVPGVFQTQIIKEVLQQHINKDLLFTKGDNIKFLNMILPDKHPKVQLEIIWKHTENKYAAEAKLFSENITFTKFKGSFIINSNYGNTGIT